MDRVPDSLAALTLPDADGRKVRLGDLWAERPAALVFVRHFGCPSCRAQTAELRGHLPALRALDASFVIVGNGAPHFARAFREDMGVDCPILCDVEKKAYGLLGMKHGRGTLLVPGALLSTARSMAKGYLPKPEQGDRFQQGGVLVVARGGHVLLRHTAAHSGDVVPPAKVIDLLRRA